LAQKLLVFADVKI